jgi:hypothetical protein
MSARDSPGGIHKSFDVGYQQCLHLYEKENWKHAARVSTEFVAQWIASTGLSLADRELFADAMWMACSSNALASWEHTRSVPAFAFRGMGDLLDWLRAQPEAEFRAIEARMLSERMRWYGQRTEGLDALEELVQVLVDLDDLSVTKDVASRVITALPGSLYISSEDQLRYDNGAITLLDDDDVSTIDPDEIGAGDEPIDRSERAADALSVLGDRLDDDEDPVATELRAMVLLREINAVGRLGNEDRFEARFEAFAALGAAAVAACDAQAQRVTDADDSKASPRTLVALLMTKASVLHTNDEDDTALVVLTEVIDRFGATDDLTVGAMGDAARELQADLLDDTDEDTD